MARKRQKMTKKITAKDMQGQQKDKRFKKRLTITPNISSD